MPVDIQGKMYTTVAERLKMARDEAGIEQVITTIEQVGDTMVARALVRLKDGRQFTGHSLVKTNATGRAERDAPLETAETSAVGRALAFAGWHGSDEGLAGAEEIAMAKQRAAWREEREERPPRRYDDDRGNVYSGAAPRPVNPGNPGGASPKQISYAETLLKERNMPPPDDLTKMSRAEVSGLIDSLLKG